MSAEVANTARVSIQKLGVESGDVLVIRFPEGYLAHEPQMVAESLKASLEEAGKELVNVIVLPNDWDIEKLTNEQKKEYFGKN